MNDQNKDFIKNILDKFTFINIFGEAATGKTTFALQLVSNLITFPERRSNSSLWFQASDSFPKARLKDLYSNQKKLLDHLLQHIFVIPNHPVRDFYQQNSILAKITQFNTPIPLNTKSLVIDNISHHLRFELSQFKSVGDRVAILDNFFDSVIIPLLFFCEQLKIILILIHEVSYDPKQDKTVMFNDQVFSRLNSLNIEMKKDLFSKRYYIHFHTRKHHKSFRYTLRQKGLQILV